LAAGRWETFNAAIERNIALGVKSAAALAGPIRVRSSPST